MQRPAKGIILFLMEAQRKKIDFFLKNTFLSNQTETNFFH